MSQTVDEIRTIPNQPVWNELKEAMLAYLERDKHLLEKELRSRFNAKEMKVIDDRILSNFIDNQSNLFTYKFDRDIVMNENTGLDTNFLIDALTDAEQWAERYFHLFKKSAILLSIDSENIEDKIEAIAPYAYMDVGEIRHRAIEDGSEKYYFSGYFVDNTTSVFFFEQLKNEVAVWKKTTTFDDVMSDFDMDKTLKENGFSFVKNLDYMPVVEWTQKGIVKAFPSSVFYLEREQIMSMSYAVDNGNIKQSTHPVLTSAEDAKDLKPKVEDFGKNRKMTLLGVDDKITQYDTGSLDTLTDIMEAYQNLSLRKALSLGVDKHAIIPTAKVESGEARKVALGYVNQKRSKYIFSAKIFERKIIRAMKELGFPISEYKGITFYEIEPAKDREGLIKVLSLALEKGFISFREAVAEFRGLSKDEADQLIENEKLEDVNNLFNIGGNNE